MKKSIIESMSKEEFFSLINSSKSIREVLINLGFSPMSGSMWLKVKDRIIRDNINTNHFRKSGCVGGSPKFLLKDILIENSTYTNMTYLKNRLIKEGLLEYKCKDCGNIGVWNSKPLVLQLEHKNGIHSDHRIENLCFLCPNCHSQTDTYSGRNSNKMRYKRS